MSFLFGSIFKAIVPIQLMRRKLNNEFWFSYKKKFSVTFNIL